MIPLDFVAGTHGHFLEYVCNRALKYTDVEFDPFTENGTSHQRPNTYLEQRFIICGHWFEHEPTAVVEAEKMIRITFSQDDLLLVSSLSLLRSADLMIDDDLLHIDTKNKLQNCYYAQTLDEIYQAYDFLDRDAPSIPRNVLREFFKFGFADPTANGYWKKFLQMIDVPARSCFDIPLQSIYDFDHLLSSLTDLATWLDRPLDVATWLAPLHHRFKTKIPFLHHRDQCGAIVRAVVNGIDMAIPHLSLLQESYVNGVLESYYGKEMPFHAETYFTNTKDVLDYIQQQASDL